MRAIEPVHFTRGYVWSSLFLLGLPGLDRVLNFLKKKSRLLLLPFFVIVFLSDNILWFINYSRKNTRTHLSVYISKEQKEVLDWLKKNSDNSSLIISSDKLISTLSTVYTPAYAWTSHNLATPFLADKRKAYDNFIRQNKIDKAWLGRNLIFILNSDDAEEKERSEQLPFLPDTVIRVKPYWIITKKDFETTGTYP
jgi:hypothetical protein